MVEMVYGIASKAQMILVLNFFICNQSSTFESLKRHPKHYRRRMAAELWFDSVFFFKTNQQKHFSAYNGSPFINF